MTLQIWQGEEINLKKQCSIYHISLLLFWCLVRRLEDLWLNDNQIASLDSLAEGAAGFRESLTIIYLERNPCVCAYTISLPSLFNSINIIFIVSDVVTFDWHCRQLLPTTCLGWEKYSPKLSKLTLKSLHRDRAFCLSRFCFVWEQTSVGMNFYSLFSLIPQI